MPVWTNEFLVESIPKLLKAAGGRVEPVLKFMGEKGMPKEFSGLAEKYAQQFAVQGLRESGVGRTNAMLRVFLERSIDKGALPAEAAPKPGHFELTKPVLAASVATRKLKGEDVPRIMGRPHLMYNVEQGGSLINPAYMLEHMFGAAGNPAIDTAEAASVMSRNSHAHLKSLRPLVKKMGNPIKDKEFVQDVTEGYAKAFPFMEQVDKLWAERAALQRGGPPRIQLTPIGGAAQPPVDVVQLNEAIAKAQAQIDAIYQPIMQKWAGRSGSVRTMLAAEKLGNPIAHPWLNMQTLQPVELDAAKAVRSLLDTIGGRAEELGIPIVKKGYVPHFMGRIIDNLNKTNPQVAAQARSLLQQLPEELKWQQRGPSSRMWWPAVQELQHYIPDANRKLAFTSVLQKWNPILKKIESSGYGDVAAYTRNYLRDLAYGAHMGRMDKVTEALVGAEYFGKVGFMPSTAFKHIWKATRLLAMNPVSAAKTAPQLFNVVKGSLLKRFGVEPGEAYRLTSQMLQMRAMFHGFTGIDASRGVAGHMLGMLSSQPTAAVEAGERGLVILSTIHKGMARGLPFDTIMQQMYHTMLNVSFLGQVDRYSWLKTPLQRLFFLFYYTPMRISETTAKMGAYSMLPYRYLDEARKGFWTTLLTGPRRRDPFGTLYATHFARNLAIVGGAAGLASAYTGISPVKLAEISMMHLPFLRETTRGMEAVPPAVMDIPKQLQEGGGLTMKSFEHALMSHYSLYAPAKLLRMIKGDIPKMYKGGPLPPEFYYIVGEGPQSTIERMQHEYAQKNEKRLMKRFAMLDKLEQYNVIAMFKNWLKERIK